MKKLKLLPFLVLGVLFLGACNNDKGKAKVEVKPAKVENTKKSKTKSSTAQSEKEVETKGVISRADFETNWSEEWHGLTTTITNVSIVKMDADTMAQSRLKGEGMVALKFVLENNGEADLSSYPDQATLVIDGQQVESNMAVSDNVGGEILTGVKKEGAVIFAVPTLTDPTAISEIRVTWQSSDTKTEDIDDMFKDNDITITLK